VTALLRLENVFAGYGGGDILSGVDLTIEADTVTVIIGPNGAGKSTLMKTVFGLVPVRQGHVNFAGKEITNLRTDRIAKLGVSYVPQEHNVFPSLTVQENLEMGAFLRDDDFSPQMTRMFELFPRLEERRRQPAGTMSGGERQMLAMGRALMVEPKLLLLDEPTAGLSPKFQVETLELVKRIRGFGVGILMVEQNARQALAIADVGIVLVTGQKRHEGRASDLLSDPEVKAMFLGG
jgi:branched-chain amino acid transport system ATP-binding protein